MTGVTLSRRSAVDAAREALNTHLAVESPLGTACGCGWGTWMTWAEYRAHVADAVVDAIVKAGAA